MRDTVEWKRNLVTSLKGQWPQSLSMSPATMCNIELGLYLLSRIIPGEPTNTLWMPMSGFPIGHREWVWNARHLLISFKSRYQWEHALKEYRRLAEWVRGYEIEEDGLFRRRPVTLCAHRFEVYRKALETTPPYVVKKIQRASGGTYTFSDARHFKHSVTLDEKFILPPHAVHRFKHTKHSIPPIHRDELINTAKWMDSKQWGKWEWRMSRVNLSVFDETGVLATSTIFAFPKKMTHWVGLVGSGKSTLMDILAVYLARLGFHVTIIVSDVINVLDRVQQFNLLGITTAPILGASTRQQHIDRLHSALADEQSGMPWQQHHLGFRSISPACPLDGLRQDNDKPLQMSEYPCLSLLSSEAEDPVACPLYSECPHHQAQRDLVNASIWVGTPESLVYAQVPPQLNEERLRFVELVSRCSDFVIFDEADQVQVRLDNIFSMTETLIGTGQKAWINRVATLAQTRMHERGHSPAANKQVQIWYNCLLAAQKAVTNLVHLLTNYKNTLETKSEYFSDWTLFVELVQILSGTKDETEPAYERLSEIFTTLIDNPFADEGKKEVIALCAITRRLIADDEDEQQARQMISEWIDIYRTSGVTFDKNKAILLTEFALLTTILQNRLNLLIRMWDQVEELLGLRSMDVSSFNRPPRDYLPLIPASALGNVLAFQYKYHDDNAGELRFMRYLGIGRWMMLRFHELFADHPGPHVLLMSGTSWADVSPSYHVLEPVAGVLHSPPEETESILQSEFSFLSIGNPPIKISGTLPEDRADKLALMLREMAGHSSILSFNGVSWLERERDLLPPGRRRILLVVGSYDEAEAAYHSLVRIRPEWTDQVVPLVRDNEELAEGEVGLRRGRVHRFPESGAWILIAPLLAIERGHNIVDNEGRAAIGAAVFLVRPHPRPDDLDYAIHSMNRWAVEKLLDGSWRKYGKTLHEAGQKFRQAAFQRWHGLLKLHMVYGTLGDYDRQAVTWNSLVTISQVIGRLVRGGCPAKVFFCDAAFMPRTAALDTFPDDIKSSLILGMRNELQRYQVDDTLSRQDRELVERLYGPFREGLRKVR